MIFNASRILTTIQPFSCNYARCAKKSLRTAHLKGPKLELRSPAHVGENEEDIQVANGAQAIFGSRHVDMSRVTEYRLESTSRALCLAPGDDSR